MSLCRLAGGDDAGDSGKVRHRVDIVPRGEQDHDRLRLGVTDLHEQPTAGTQSLMRLRNQAADHVEAFVPGEDRHARLVVLDDLLDLVSFVEPDVGRVGDYEIEAGIADDVGEDVALGEMHADTEAPGVGARDFQRRGREIDGVNLGLRQFTGDSDGDGSRAGAYVDEFEARSQGEVVDEIEDHLDDVLGLRTRNEHGGRDEKVGLPELLMSSEVLQGLSHSAAPYEQVILRLLSLGKLALRVGEEIGAVAAEDVKDEDLGADAGCVDSCGIELGDGGVERVAELHKFIVRREPAGVCFRDSLRLERFRGIDVSRAGDG
jgi:hypothetical protein